jgi:hypothetical protein
MDLAEWIRQDDSGIFDEDQLSCFAAVCERTLEAPDKLAQTALELRQLHGTITVDAAVRLDGLPDRPGSAGP